MDGLGQMNGSKTIHEKSHSSKDSTNAHFERKLGLSGGNDGGLSNVLLLLVIIVVVFDWEGDDVSRMAAAGERVVVSAAQLRQNYDLAANSVHAVIGVFHRPWVGFWIQVRRTLKWLSS